MQSPLALLFPPQCVSCGEPVETAFGLCGPCWRQTPFIDGLICDTCGTPLPGEDDGHVTHCDDCMSIARPWARGRSTLIYKDNARKLVLALKHGDRLDLARPAGAWMARAVADILDPNMVVVPIPAHWTRLFQRRYNQAAVLAKALAAETQLVFAPDALIRPRRTNPHDGMSLEARFTNMQDAIQPHPKRGVQLSDRKVLLVDDVMTSGATFAAAAEACQVAGATEVRTLALARVVKDA
ncbi:double zinc ribbon domain-containing protein [Aliiroseovarius subalbicans]|uniref:ComF family protein n=1 Tax=Aliiroseovarius subalbicans TaxID=2925840 RepID=UPI001F5932B0|nr:double zinc ribbon domain-containing protein [Aliiroseovarius subalbicans]MCI2400085.1 double zinc ribbon domain-containing protein [Aliiroseovarius subalbicans]